MLFSYKNLKIIIYISLHPLLIATLGDKCFAENAQLVKVESIRVEPIKELLPLSGTIISPKVSVLAAKESGYVQSRMTFVGDQVFKGQPLLTLDQTLAKMELERLILAVNEAQHLYAEAKRLKDEALHLIKSNHLAKTVVESRKVNASTQLARLKQLELDVAIQKEKVLRHQLTAPFSGVIADILTEKGQWLDSNHPAVRLVQMNPLAVEVSVPERYYGQIQLNDPVIITLGANQQIITSSVTRIIPINNNVSRNHRIRALINNPKRQVIPGMTASVSFVIGNSNVAVKQVPSDALTKKIMEKHHVWVVKNQNGQQRVASVEVDIKRRMDSWTEVISEELHQGDLVVVLGNENLKQNQLVSINSGSSNATLTQGKTNTTKEASQGNKNDV